MFSITIDKSKVSGSNTNFPYLFSELCPGIPAEFWAGVTDFSGLDIRFFDTDGISELNREIVLFDAGGTVEAWVQIPALTDAADKVIHCSYGGTTRSNDREVWDSIGYDLVYHLQFAEVFDSTSNGNDAIHQNQGVIDEKIHKGGDFQDPFWITAPTFPIGSVFSYSFWVKTLNTSGTIKCLVGKGTDSGSVQATVEYDYSGWGAGKIGFFVVSGGSVEVVSPFAINDGLEHFVVAKRNGTSFKLYIDGILIASQLATIGEVYDAESLDFGRYPSAANPHYHVGSMDEIRVISGIDISDDQIATEYNNQGDPATFSFATYIPPVPPTPGDNHRAMDIALWGQNVNNAHPSLSAGLLASFGYFDWIPAPGGNITNMVDQTVGLLVEQFRRERPFIRGLVSALAAFCQDIENVLFDLLKYRSIGSASGKQLDLLGAMVGINRTGPDDVYRDDINFQIYINRSNGSPETLISCLSAVTNATSIELIEAGNARVIMTIIQALKPIPANMFEKMKRVKAAGVALEINVNNSTNQFVFSGDVNSLGVEVSPPFYFGYGFGETNFPDVGGCISELITI